MYFVTRRRLISISNLVILNISLNVYIPDEQACSDGGEEKLPERARGRNLEKNQTQNGSGPRLGDGGSVCYVVSFVIVNFIKKVFNLYIFRNINIHLENDSAFLP